MTFVQRRKTEKFPRNEHVDIHVTHVTLNADAPEANRLEMLEIREYLKEGDLFGWGVMIPMREAKDLIRAVERVHADHEAAKILAKTGAE